MKAEFVIRLAKDGPKGWRAGLPSRQLAGRIVRDAARERRPLLIAMGFILALSVIQTSIPQIIRYTIDVVIPGQRFDLLPWVAGVFLAAALSIGGLNFGRSYMMALFGQRTIDNLRTDLYRHTQHLSISFFDNHRTGELMSRLDRDVVSIGNVITADIADILADSLTCLLILTYLLSQNWRLTLLLLMTWPLRIYLNRRFGHYLRGAYRDVQERSEAVSSQLQETLSTISVIKAFGNEPHEIRRFARQSRHLMEASLRAVKLWALLYPVVDLLNHIGTIVILAFGAREVMNGHLTIGGLAAFLAYINLINQPIKRFSRMSNIIHAAVVAWEKVFDLLDHKPEVAERPDAKPLPVFRGHVRFEGVGFGYRDRDPVIHDFDLVCCP
jgi:ABC-type bacteriocin/lantibiotic exporter with double-glycine peptidase domain